MGECGLPTRRPRRLIYRVGTSLWASSRQARTKHPQEDYHRVRLTNLALAAVVLGVCGASFVSTSSASSSTRSAQQGISGPAVGLTSLIATTSDPPAALEATALIKGAELSQAIGTPTQGLQDDGGFTTTTSSGSHAFWSQAETATQDTHLVVTLESFNSTASASEGYQAAISTLGASQPLAGVGQEATAADELFSSFSQACNRDAPACEARLRAGSTFSGEGSVTVLKGSQVLTVTPTPSATAMATLTQDQSSLSGAGAASSVQSLISLYQTVLETQPQAAAKALATRMSGQSNSTTYLELPAGAVNPCTLSTRSLLSALRGSPVTEQGYMKSDDPPAQACSYDIGDAGFTDETETAQQAAASVPPQTLATLFSGLAKQGAIQKTKSTDGVMITLSMQPNPAWEADVVIAVSPRAHDSADRRSRTDVYLASDDPIAEPCEQNTSGGREYVDCIVARILSQSGSLKISSNECVKLVSNWIRGVYEAAYPENVGGFLDLVIGSFDPDINAECEDLAGSSMFGNS
jgi:hypothetical protein